MLSPALIDYHYTYEDDGDGNCMPIITLEVLSDSSKAYNASENDLESQQNAIDVPETGFHFLSAEDNKESPNSDTNENKESDNNCKEPQKARNDFLEYMTRNDGSVICKLCGEILQSRTHWYRHKYKLHVIQPLNPAPLFQCEQCLVYFKSRKGYIGHIASRHSEVLTDTSPALTNSQAEALSKHTNATQIDVKEEPDPELSIPKTSVPNYQNNVKHKITNVPNILDSKKSCRNSKGDGKSDWEERRTKEEKLVADIIDRVRRECEAQGLGGAGRRGYTRRTTVMHT